MSIIDVGALCFGVVIGWVTSRTLRRSMPSGLSDIATVLGAVGGATITGLFRQDTNAFGYYCIGLLAGFFVYVVCAITIAKQEGQAIGDWLGTEPTNSGPRRPGPPVGPPP